MIPSNLKMNNCSTFFFFTSLQTLYFCSCQEQFGKHVNPNIDLQIYIYYGPDRVRDIPFLKQHDIVISTYGTVAADYRSFTTKDVCVCGYAFLT